MPSSHKNHSATAERRRHHRISTGLDAAFTIGVVMTNGTVQPAVPVDISVSGLCLQWPPDETVMLDIGERVELRIHPSTADAPITVHADVRWAGADVDGRIRYGLEFVHLYEIFEHITPILWRLCHGQERGKASVSPPPQGP